MARTGRPRTINDLTEYLEEHPDSESTKLVLSDGIRSNITFPVGCDGEVMAFLFVSSGIPQTYRSVDEDTLDAIGRLVWLLFSQHQQLLPHHS